MQKLLFYALIIVLPTQLGRHFWPEFAFVSGVRVDYLSPTLYLTDMLIMGIFLLEVGKGLPKVSGRVIKILLMVSLVALGNIFISLSPAVTIYKWLKVLELGFLVWWVAKNKIDPWTVVKLLLVPVLYESILLMWQFSTQGAVGLWILGERSFNSSTPGIANTIINGQVWLRPYGTFPHPNVAGGFLAIALPLIIWYFPHKYRRIAAGIVGLGVTGLMLTMSRSAMVVGYGAIGLVLVKRFKIRKLWVTGFIGVGLCLAILRTGNEAFVVREQLNNSAMAAFLQSPVLGVGLGTSPLFDNLEVLNFAMQNQPTHNSFLLTSSETGLIGLILLGTLILSAGYSVWREKTWGLVTPLLSVMVLGISDHYFFTLQQGQVMFAVILGLCFAHTSIKTGKIG